MAALQTAMFPILVIRLPKLEGDGEEKTEAGRHLKRKTRIRGVFGEGGQRRRMRRQTGRKGEGIVRPMQNFSCNFPRRLLPPPGAHKHFLSRGNGVPSTFSPSSALPPLPPHSHPHVLRRQPFISSADSEAVRRNKSRLLYKCCQRE